MCGYLHREYTTHLSTLWGASVGSDLDTVHISTGPFTTIWFIVTLKQYDKAFEDDTKLLSSPAISISSYHSKFSDGKSSILMTNFTIFEDDWQLSCVPMFQKGATPEILQMLHCSLIATSTIIGEPTVTIALHFVTFRNLFLPLKCHYWQKIALVILQLHTSTQNFAKFHFLHSLLHGFVAIPKRPVCPQQLPILHHYNPNSTLNHLGNAIWMPSNISCLSSLI